MSITLDLDARDTDELWTDSGETTHPTDGVRYVRWNNKINTAQKFIELVGGDGPLWETTPTSLLLPAGDFRPAGIQVRELANFGGTIADFLDVDGFSIAAAICVTALAASSANTWTLPRILGEGGFVGLHIGVESGVYYAYGYVWDGGNKNVKVALTQNVACVILVTLSGGTLSISKDGGTPVTTSCGNVASLAGMPSINVVSVDGSDAFFLGEIMADDSGTELTSAAATMITDWVTGAASAKSIVRRRTGGFLSSHMR